MPWDQVLDVVLKSAQLTYQLDGPVVRVLTREARTKELQDEVEPEEGERRRAGSRTARMRLNYASAADVKKLLETARVLSERGTRRRSTSAPTC